LKTIQIKNEKEASRKKWYKLDFAVSGALKEEKAQERETVKAQNWWGAVTQLDQM
jgi:hypothetical protein